MVLFRRLLGDVLRGARRQRGMTLRELSAEARVSLGYISEIERGQKEASSELLASLCQAMDLPLSSVLREVSDAVAVEEALLGGVTLSTVGEVTSTPITASRPTGDVVASAA
jgi:transcriptional regulator with XRE-family HTH domain